MKKANWKSKTGYPTGLVPLFILLFPVVLTIYACKERFTPNIKNVNTNYLVVEGVLNVGDQETNIRLSRTVGLKTDSPILETGAQVKIQGEDNSTLLLPEKGNGNYGVSSAFLDTTIRYRLSINTSDGQQYLSEYVKMVKNPPIDSVNWERTNDGVDIYVNTHTNTGEAGYYRWQFEEVWEYHANFFSDLKYAYDPPGVVSAVLRRDSTDPEIYRCWHKRIPSTILLGSSVRLSQDIIHLPVRTIKNNSQELSVLYYIHVKQFALNKDGFSFWERMKKNTESVGSIFDAQPSQLNGNIKCVTDPTAPVVGYFSISNQSEASIFINRSQLEWNYGIECFDLIISNDPISIKKQAQGTLPVTPQNLGPFASILTFHASAPECVDCRLNGGTNIKPDFWP